MRLRRVFRALPLSILLVLSGCLEFEQQMLTYRYDSSTDTLRIYQCYQGIFGADAKEALSDEELTQLDSVLAGGRTFFFSNWIFEYNRETLRKALDDLKKPQEGAEPKMDAEMVTRAEAVCGLLLDNVKVDNGPFYFGEGGKLCAVQRVTVRQFSKVLAAGNASLRDLARLRAAKQDTTGEQRERLLQSVQSKQDYIQLVGNQFRVRFPVSQAEYDEALDPKSDNHRQVEEFKRAGGKISFSDNEVTVTLGEPAAQRVRLTLPFSTKAYSTNAVEAARKRTQVLPKFDVEADAAKFIEGVGK